MCVYQQLHIDDDAVICDDVPRLTSRDLPVLSGLSIPSSRFTYFGACWQFFDTHSHVACSIVKTTTTKTFPHQLSMSHYLASISRSALTECHPCRWGRAFATDTPSAIRSYSSRSFPARSASSSPSHGVLQQPRLRRSVITPTSSSFQQTRLKSKMTESSQHPLAGLWKPTHLSLIHI